MATIITNASDIIKSYALEKVRVLNAKNNNPYKGSIEENTAADKQLYRSYLGTPVLTDLTLGLTAANKVSPWAYTVKNGPYYNANIINYTDAQGNNKQYKAMSFATTLVTVDQTKTIVKTQVQGMNGSIKEYVGMDDYIITITGVIPGSNNHYPAEEVRNLNDLCSAPVAIPVIGSYLQNLDIDYIVINHFTLKQTEGNYSQQPFTINAYSAKDINLVITTGKTGNISAQ